MTTSVILAAVQTIREADAADVPPYVRTALASRLNTTAHLERLASVLPYLPTEAPVPTTLSPYEVYGAAGLCYTLPAEGWRETIATLRARHPAAPLATFRDGSTSVHPASIPAKGGTVVPCADFVIKVDAVADYTPTITIAWWTEPAPGVRIGIEVRTDGYHPLLSRVRYSRDNAPKSDRVRQHPEDRKWSASWTWGSGSTVIKWWTSPGQRSPMSWTWPVGTEIDHAIGEDK